ADGEKQAAVLKSEGDKTAVINRAQGEAARIQLIADATATAISSVAAALNAPGGNQAASLDVAKQYVNAFAHLARTNNTLIVPANVADVATLVSSAMTVMDNVKKTMPGPASASPAAKG
ncbi:MAG: band-7 C-terminal domain-containing protein, partial [Rhodanobacter sp.]